MVAAVEPETADAETVEPEAGVVATNEDKGKGVVKVGAALEPRAE